MKFRRARPSTPWLVQDIYLDRSWGRPFYQEPPRPSRLRQVFLFLVICFFLADAVLAVSFVTGLFAPSRPPGGTAQGPAATRSLSGSAGALQGQEPTRVARRATVAPPTPERRQRTRTPAPTVVRPTAVLPTNAPRPTAAPLPPPPPAQARNFSPARVVSIALPPSLNRGDLGVKLPPEPVECTPNTLMPDTVTFSIKLCAGQGYRPFVVRGDDIGIFGDPSAVINTSGRGFGIIADGTRIVIKGVTIRASTDPNDAGIYLCLYPDCRGRPGGVGYGGGILVRGDEATVIDSVVSGGVTGVAAERVRGLLLVNNRLDNSSGWGSYNFAVEDSVFVGNSLSGNNRSCTTTDGQFQQTGCESAGWLCVACHENIVARNNCTNSGDCFYINGEGNLQSNYNRFHQNHCRASPHNCYEVTFSIGNEFVENIAEADPASGAACKYPFWVGGSRVVFARNRWSCSITPEVALQHAIQSTSVPTSIEYQ
jgi:hypothetical protein